jgi:hypothetical protein
MNRMTKEERMKAEAIAGEYGKNIADVLRDKLTEAIGGMPVASERVRSATAELVADEMIKLSSTFN